MSIICAIPTLIVLHVILTKNIIQLQGAIFARIRNIQIGARHFVENHFVEYDFRRIRHLVEKAFFFSFAFSKCDILSNSFFFFSFFFMYDILSNFFFFVPNGLIFTVDYLHSDHAWRIFPGDYRAVLAQTGCWGGKETCRELCWK